MERGSHSLFKLETELWYAGPWHHYEPFVQCGGLLSNFGELLFNFWLLPLSVGVPKYEVRIPKYENKTKVYSNPAIFFDKTQDRQVQLSLYYYGRDLPKTTDSLVPNSGDKTDGEQYLEPIRLRVRLRIIPYLNTLVYIRRPIGAAINP